MELSHVNATGQRPDLPPWSLELSHFFDESDAGSVVEEATVGLDESLPPQAARRAPTAHVANNDDRAAARILVQPVL